MGGKGLSHSSCRSGGGRVSARSKKASVLLALLCVLLCLFPFFGCSDFVSTEEEVTVYMPDGAPSLAMAKMMADDTDGDGITYKVVAPSLIKSKVTSQNAESNADICILPALAASVLLGKGNVYQMLGVVTHGNLYLIAKNGETYTRENLHRLLGKTVGVLQIADVPGLTFKSVLKENGVAYQDVSGVEEAAADKVNLLGISGAADVGALQGVDVYVLAEPAVSMKIAAGIGFTLAGDIQVLYGGENGYPQAVLVAKKSLIETRAEFIQSCVRSIKASAEWLNVASGEAITAAVYAHLEDGAYQSTLKAAALKRETLARCGVRFVAASACKEEFAAYLARIGKINGGKTGLVNEAFYCPLHFGGGI